MSKQSFADLGASSAVVDALRAEGITEPFPVQTLVMPDVRAGHDVLVKSPTGSGKTLAFGIPMVDLIEAEDPRPSALVVCPTRELAGQIVEDLRPLAHARALSIAAVYGGAGLEKQSKLARRAHILVATPGRLEDLLERRAFSLDRVRILVLDEADRMLDMGFRPAVDRIVRALPRQRQTLFFSATLEGSVLKVADSYTHDARKHEHVAPSRAACRRDAPLPRRHERHEARRAGRAAAPRGCGPQPRLRADQARGGPPGQAPARPQDRRASRCTATGRSRSASGRSRASPPARWPPSWPPTSPRAASTSTTWAT